MSSGPYAGAESHAIQIDPDVAHAARVYDYLLGGLDNFPSDREAAEQLGEALGGLERLRGYARANRDFLVRAVRYLVGDCEVRQFLDIGTGVPNADNTHAVAQQSAPDARVVSVDNDPMVLAHAHSLLRSTPEGAAGYINGDLRDPERILKQAAATLDLDRPVAVILVAVLHLVDPDADPHRLVARIMDRLAPGSYLVVSHLTVDIHPEESIAGVETINQITRERFTLRDRPTVARFFDGLKLVDPGLVPVDKWEAGAEAPPPADRLGPDRAAPYYGGVGYKPRTARAIKK